MHINIYMTECVPVCVPVCVCLYLCARGCVSVHLHDSSLVLSSVCVRVCVCARACVCVVSLLYLFLYSSEDVSNEA